jgi:hypothetical protein
MTQVPGTDSTTRDAHIRGVFGEKVAPGLALMHQWADHRIEVRKRHIRWFINEDLVLEGEAQQAGLHGFFGIRQRYERNTCYDDFQIKIL